MTQKKLGDTMVNDVDPRYCPGCHADLRGTPIPERHFRHNVPDNPDWDQEREPSCEQQQEDWGRCHCLPYGDKPPEERFFWRTIGIEIPGVYDGTLFYQCPDCGCQWHRWVDERMRAKAARYMTHAVPNGG